MVLSLVVAILILGALIALHEAGHALAAIVCRVPLAEFAVGFGPVLWATHMGGVRLTWRVIPVGGFVRFAAPPAVVVTPDHDPRPLKDPLAHVPPARRIGIALGGPVGSIVAGGVCFLLAHLGWGIPPRPALDGFDSVAAAQFTPGLATAIQLTTSPQVLVAADRHAPLSLASPSAPWQPVGPTRALVAARDAMWQATTLMGEMTWWLLANPPILYESLGGPVGIVSRSAEVAIASQAARDAAGPYRSAGTVDTNGSADALVAPAPRPQAVPFGAATRGYALLLLYFGLLSVGMAFLNLMPLPPFDGFHATIATLELVARRRLPYRVRIATALLGAVVLTGLLARGTWNDIHRHRIVDGAFQAP